MIELKNVSKCIGESAILKQVCLHVARGEIFGIIGKSGAGKSSLLRSMNLLLRPDGGEVWVNGQDLMSLSSSQLRAHRRSIGMIFQEYHLLNSKTVFENIALPMIIAGFAHDQIKIKVTELLELVELSHKTAEKPSQLSGGQKQRVAIARALSCSPQVLLCDEATSALDPQSIDAILNLLKKINALYGITIVLITHQMHIVKRMCHRLALMQAGELVETMDLKDWGPESGTLIQSLIYEDLSPHLPDSLKQRILTRKTNRPVIRLRFEGSVVRIPFISQISRELNLDINILLANIDHFSGISCGILVVEAKASEEKWALFDAACLQNDLTVDILGYLDEWDE